MKRQGMGFCGLLLFGFIVWRLLHATLQPMSPSRFDKYDHRWVVFFCYLVLYGVPMLFYLVAAGYRRPRLSPLCSVFSAVWISLLGYLAMIVFGFSATWFLSFLFGHERWFNYFGEIQFLVQFFINLRVLLFMTVGFWLIGFLEGETRLQARISAQSDQAG